MVRVYRHLSVRTRALLIIGIILFIAGVSYADYFTPQYYTFSVFLLIPVAVATWLLGRREGVAASAVSVLALLAAHLVNVGIYGHAALHLWDAFAQLVVLLTVTYILGALRRANEQEAALARSDPLTGAANRRSLLEWGEYEIRRAERSREPITIVYVDIDNFKLVNDAFGHQAGDAVLKNAARIMRENVRAVDTVARLGGDEFALILPSAGYDEADETVRRVRKKLASMRGGDARRVEFSFGAVTYDNPDCPIEEMLSAADELMYEVKTSGKNGYKHLRAGNARRVMPGEKRKTVAGRK